jgi:hypothetical protein
LEGEEVDLSPGESSAAAATFFVGRRRREGSASSLSMRCGTAAGALS